MCCLPWATPRNSVKASKFDHVKLSWLYWIEAVPLAALSTVTFQSNHSIRCELGGGIAPR